MSAAVPDTAIVLAAGLGSRLRQSTADDTPKCIRTVAGQPFLGYSSSFPTVGPSVALQPGVYVANMRATRRRARSVVCDRVADLLRHMEDNRSTQPPLDRGAMQSPAPGMVKLGESAFLP